MFQLNRAFIVSMILAVAATVGFTLLQLHPFAVLTGGLLPLVYYFYRLLVISKSGISQTAVDSIYYFGFIITIASLAASVLSVAFYGIDRDINLIIAQFGVGLLATGLALVFRMILIAKLESLNQKDISETIDDYVRRIDHVVTRVEASAASFDGLSSSLIERTEKISQSTQNEFQSAMHKSAKAFQEEMLKIVSVFSEQTSVSIKKATTSSEELFSLVQNISLSGHVQDITTQVGAISSGLKQFSSETGQYTRTVLEDMHKMTKAVTAQALEDFSSVLQGVVSKTSSSLDMALAEIGQLNFSEESQEVKNELQALTKNLGTYAKKLASVHEKTETFAEDIAAQTGVAIRESMESHTAAFVNGFGESFKNSIENTSSKVGSHMQVEASQFIAHLSSGIEGAMQTLKVQLETIQSSLSKSDLHSTAHSIRQVFDGLSRDTENLSVAIKVLNKSLSEKTDFQIEQSMTATMERVASVWNNHIGQFSNAMDEQLTRLSQSVIAVDNAVDLGSIQDDFNDLSNGIKASLQGMDAMRAALEKITAEAGRGTESLEAVSIAAGNASQKLSSVHHELSHPIITSQSRLIQPTLAQAVQG